VAGRGHTVGVTIVSRMRGRLMMVNGNIYGWRLAKLRLREKGS